MTILERIKAELSEEEQGLLVGHCLEHALKNGDPCSTIDDIPDDVLEEQYEYFKKLYLGGKRD